MNEKDSYRKLEWASYSLLILITIAAGLLTSDILPLDLFKLALGILLVIACILFLILRKNHCIYHQPGKNKV